MLTASCDLNDFLPTNCRGTGETCLHTTHSSQLKLAATELPSYLGVLLKCPPSPSWAYGWGPRLDLKWPNKIIWLADASLHRWNHRGSSPSSKTHNGPAACLSLCEVAGFDHGQLPAESVMMCLSVLPIKATGTGPAHEYNTHRQ